jgi:hypothetical protein
VSELVKKVSGYREESSFMVAFRASLPPLKHFYKVDLPPFLPPSLPPSLPPFLSPSLRININIYTDFTAGEQCGEAVHLTGTRRYVRVVQPLQGDLHHLRLCGHVLSGLPPCPRARLGGHLPRDSRGRVGAPPEESPTDTHWVSE